MLGDLLKGKISESKEGGATCEVAESAKTDINFLRSQPGGGNFLRGGRGFLEKRDRDTPWGHMRVPPSRKK